VELLAVNTGPIGSAHCSACCRPPSATIFPTGIATRSKETDVVADTVSMPLRVCLKRRTLGASKEHRLIESGAFVVLAWAE